VAKSKTNQDSNHLKMQSQVFSLHTKASKARLSLKIHQRSEETP